MGGNYCEKENFIFNAGVHYDIFTGSWLWI